MQPSRDIRLIAPSGYPHDTGAMQRGIGRLEASGHRVSGMDVLERRYLRFAGSDEARAADINALADPSQALPDLALAVRGGYGAHPVLPLLDYDGLRERLGASPVPLVGHSDFTAIQCALYAKSGLVTFGGPMLGPDFGAPDVDEMTMDHFWQTLSASQGRASWSPSGLAVVDVEGLLWGGNLAMLSGMVGSPYFPGIDGGILFVEDVAEPPYRVERMLYHLLYAGVLGRQKALILGDFTSYRLSPYDNGYDLDIAFERIAAAAGIPVIQGLPFGHDVRKFTLPFGVPARLRVEGDEAVLTFAGQPHLRPAENP
ncbi:muramoyltetrapeptide carboxypeptidase [Luteibacter sp. Sphag1AF]|uniref:muramoyltetrapeptide carboxypeptidase n=1 Tax=Luteibacter sp. Sphag1AF TaxID=2587031 RepID=UPI0016210C72|nr:muramoyltetrapeptide carboxypeptidase [Luteibacter sp. Sphag1AF]MBB3227493.1 muramoyltetrapeptide carboxypeptidase [Luteibacter sp. Sphag1AF]